MDFVSGGDSRKRWRASALQDAVAIASRLTEDQRHVRAAEAAAVAHRHARGFITSFRENRDAFAGGIEVLDLRGGGHEAFAEGEAADAGF